LTFSAFKSFSPARRAHALSSFSLIPAKASARVAGAVLRRLDAIAVVAAVTDDDTDRRSACGARASPRPCARALIIVDAAARIVIVGVIVNLDTKSNRIESNQPNTTTSLGARSRRRGVRAAREMRAARPGVGVEHRVAH
jgi:hypothetical protein